jgi:SAM-dependent methyltransferase
MDIRKHNSAAWDQQVARENIWTRPASPEVIAAARAGRWAIVLTPIKPVPAAWLPEMPGTRVLCLAGGGGQQGPILAAAGAMVTVFDNSPRQLAQDRLVAEREGLVLTTVEGDMADLSAFPDGSFDLIVQPVSNVFVPDVRPVWREAYRVVRAGGALLSGFLNPVVHTFDQQLSEQGIFQVKYALPYSDLTSLRQEDLQTYLDAGDPLEFGHTFQDQLGGQLDAGFLIAGFYEDARPSHALAQYLPMHFATRAIKPAG